jgi:hypothetical protein
MDDQSALCKMVLPQHIARGFLIAIAAHSGMVAARFQQ